MLMLLRWHIHACPFVLVCQQSGNPTVINFPVSQSLYHLPHGIVSSAKLHCDFPSCHPLVFCGECINFLLFVFCGGSTWLMAARQISDVPVAIFEVFYPAKHIASLTPMQESP
jgi:hypothetical protein